MKLVESKNIGFYTMQMVNGVKHMSSKQVEDLKHIVCSDLKIEKTEDNFKAIEEAVKLYFSYGK
jgi:hypothetical protein